jgi:hypothetical protein
VARDHHDLGELGLQRPAAVLGDLDVAADKGLRGHRAETHEHLRPDLGQLGVEPLPAGADVLGLRARGADERVPRAAA